jgi:hypothetical protein
VQAGDPLAVPNAAANPLAEQAGERRALDALSEPGKQKRVIDFIEKGVISASAT